MKRIITLVLAALMVMSLFAFATADETAVTTYEEFVAAEVATEVTVETYVQAKQGWWTDSNSGVSQASIYTQSEDGAYFLYNLPCSEEEYEALVPGTKIRVTGYKAEWSGEVEIVDATFEIIEDAEPYVAEAEDVTELFGTDDLAAKINRFVAVKGATVAASNDNGAPFLFKWDGSGSEGDDLYFNVTIGENTYTFTVESYLCGPDTEVYKKVMSLGVGDVIDLEGFLYWYEGPQPHITNVVMPGEAAE